MANTHETLGECQALAGAAFPNATASSQRETALYLAHTNRGESIRALAGAIGTHPSTVLRTVRRVEDRRDDPLLDHVLCDMERSIDPTGGAVEAKSARAATPQRGAVRTMTALPDEAAVRREAKRFLRRLSEPGSILVIAPGTEKGGVFCAANQHRRPIAMLPVSMAAEFLRRDWIAVAARSSAAVRYKITDAGRAFLKRTLSEEAIAKGDGRANVSPFAGQHAIDGQREMMDPFSGERETLNVNLGESPLGWLARRRGVDGKPFLAPEEVEAGERLRNDFEAAQIGPSVAQDWRKFLTPGDRLSGSPVSTGPASGPSEARDRVAKALGALGPGLADVALRACCFLEGLEACERRMGWSARSGKVVLKIALQRLSGHYGLAPFKDG